MAGVIFQSILVVCAGAALYLLWKRIGAYDRVFGIIVAFGLLGRSVLGQMFFWTSYLDLVNRELHLGRGHWFFAADGWNYMHDAVRAAGGGPAAILMQWKTSGAATYMNLLTAFVLMFGGVASSGIFLNLFCYVTTCWLIVRCSRDTPGARKPALFVLLALTFYPSGVLWSSQPLKDTMVHLLLVALVVCALGWQHSWRERPRAVWIIGSAAGLWIAVLGISSLRWYLGLATLGGMGLFLVLMVATSRQRRLALLGASLLLVALLTKAVVYGGATGSIPVPIRNVLSLSFGKVSSLAPTVMASTEQVRGQFERTAGGTEIRVPPGSSRVLRWTAAFIAITVPHFALEPLDFIQIGGGRGLFWFADLDTIIFDLVAVASIVLLLRERRSVRFSNPLVWLLLSSLVVMTVPLLYAVTNFGALLRMRGMIYVLLALAPLAGIWGARASRPDMESTQIE